MKGIHSFIFQAVLVLVCYCDEKIKTKNAFSYESFSLKIIVSYSSIYQKVIYIEVLVTGKYINKSTERQIEIL